MVSQREAMEEMAKHIKQLEEAHKAAEEKMDQKLAEHLVKLEEEVRELRTEISEVESRLSQEEEKAEPEEPSAEEPKKKPKKVKIIETLVP